MRTALDLGVDALASGGRFVLGDVVVPERPEDGVIAIEEGFDRRDSLTDQLAWLVAAGVSPTVAWTSGDLAVLVAVRQA